MRKSVLCLKHKFSSHPSKYSHLTAVSITITFVLCMQVCLSIYLSIYCSNTPLYNDVFRHVCHRLQVLFYNTYQSKFVIFRRPHSARTVFNIMYFQKFMNEYISTLNFTSYYDLLNSYSHYRYINRNDGAKVKQVVLAI